MSSGSKSKGQPKGRKRANTLSPKVISNGVEANRDKKKTKMEANKCQKNSIDMSDVSQDSNLDTIENPIATTSGANPPLERPTWLDEVLTVIAATENRINKKIEETEDHIEVKVAATVTKDTK